MSGGIVKAKIVPLTPNVLRREEASQLVTDCAQKGEMDPTGDALHVLFKLVGAS
jgi:hypothetical protein